MPVAWCTRRRAGASFRRDRRTGCRAAEPPGCLTGRGDATPPGTAPKAPATTTGPGSRSTPVAYRLAGPVVSRTACCSRDSARAPCGTAPSPRHYSMSCRPATVNAAPSFHNSDRTPAAVYRPRPGRCPVSCGWVRPGSGASLRRDHHSCPEVRRAAVDRVPVWAGGVVLLRARRAATVLAGGRRRHVLSVSTQTAVS